MKPPDSSMVVELLESLADLDARELRETAARTLAAQPEVFDPVKVLIPALAALYREEGSSGDPVFVRLWHHAADSLLVRSERPPEPPKDWHQEATIKCQCEDCRALQRFARAPSEQVHRFPAASERRRHLHSTIERYRLDMTHVTERKGRPYTLVCTKTRRAFERRCKQYHEEIAAMAALVPLSPEALTEPTGRPARLKAAIARSQGDAR